MANPELEKAPRYPFTAWNFAVEIEVPGVSTQICSGAFAECDGLEMTMEVKTIREGGNNSAPIRLTGPMSLGQLTLKRGMTANFDLWDWWNALQEPGNGKLRATTKVVLFAADGITERARFVLHRCLPTKLKAPALNAKDGIVAVEELQLVYESLELVKPSP
jgi:phage tail-like protein